MIRLNVFILIEKSENRKPLIEAAVELVSFSLRDKGVIDYDVFSSLTADDRIFICETWKDEESLEAHMHTDHFKRLVARMEELGTLTLEKFNF